VVKFRAAFIDARVCAVVPRLVVGEQVTLIFLSVPFLVIIEVLVWLDLRVDLSYLSLHASFLS
jgi:hypothetical protein